MPSLYRQGRWTPQRIPEAGAVVRFRGRGKARFRMQHTGDWQGRPDVLGWVDVSPFSLPGAAEPTAGAVTGVVVDTVEGDLDIGYRRHRARWLRVVPLDHRDKAAIVACRSFTVSLEDA